MIHLLVKFQELVLIANLKENRNGFSNIGIPLAIIANC